jgi:integrase
MVETAARRAELISIQFNQIDYTNSVIKLKAEQTKTGRARKLLLSDKAVEILKRREEKANGSPFVFSSQFKPDQPVHPDSMTTTFTRLRKRVLEKEGIDIRDLRLHDLRHTAATNWKAAGLDVVEVMSLTGHTQFKSVKRYMNPTAENVAAKMKALVGEKGVR